MKYDHACPTFYSFSHYGSTRLSTCHRMETERVTETGCAQYLQRCRNCARPGLTLCTALCSFLGWTKPTLRGLWRTLARAEQRWGQRPGRADWWGRAGIMWPGGRAIDVCTHSARLNNSLKTRCQWSNHFLVLVTASSSPEMQLQRVPIIKYLASCWLLGHKRKHCNLYCRFSPL